MVSVNLTVCEHPLLQHHLAILRNKNSHPEQFRLAIQRVIRILLLTATSNLPLIPRQIETPITSTECQVLAANIPIIAAPILRAGLTMSDVFLDLVPEAHIYHIGLYRDEETFAPVTYYNKLPRHNDYQHARVFILDPMLATGGSILAALQIMRELGVIESNITIASVIGAPEGIKAVTQVYPEIKIVLGALDKCLNEKAYIVPGLGDAGDRSFAT